MARSKEEILRDVLEVALEKVNKSRMMYRANLTYAQLIENLKHLEEKGMIVKLEGYFVTTEKGRAYILAYQKMLEIMQTNS
jgi:predicted transcriptional regulator